MAKTEKKPALPKSNWRPPKTTGKPKPEEKK